MATDTQEDFTFPATTADSPLYFMESPPLWGPVSSNSRSSCKSVQVEDEGNTFALSSSQEFKTNNADQEKMDKLWEYQNEEISKASPKRPEYGYALSPERGIQVSCVKGFKLSRSDGHNMLVRKKAIVLVFIRVLKKIFVMHHSGFAIKKRAF